MINSKRAKDFIDVLSFVDNNNTAVKLCKLDDTYEAIECAEKEIKERAIKIYRDLYPSYKVLSRFECGNHSHRRGWKTKSCDMNCQYMKLFMEKIGWFSNFGVN